MNDIEELTKLVVAFRDARNWKQYHNAKDSALSLVLEASELLELFQWKNGAEIDAVIADHRDALADELADVLYWVLLMAHDGKISLPQALKEKIRKNETKYPVALASGRKDKYTHY